MATQQTAVFPVFPENRSLTRTAALCMRCVKWLPRYGWQGMLRKATLHRQRTAPLDRRLTRRELDRLRAEQFPHSIRFIVRMSVSADMLPDTLIAVQSLREQTYHDWQLWPDCSDDAVYAALAEAAGGAARITRTEPGNDDFLLCLLPTDRLHPAALSLFAIAVRDQQAELVYADEDVYEQRPCDLCKPQLRPDFSLEALRGFNYIGRFFVFRARLVRRDCKALSSAALTDSHALLLQLCEQTSAIVHVPAMLLYRQAREAALDAPDSTAAVRCVQAHLQRMQPDAHAFPVAHGCVRVCYHVHGSPLVSILIPNRDQPAALETCVRSIMEKSTWRQLEIIILENNSIKPETFALYHALQQEYACVRVVRWEKEYSYAAINNFGAEHAQGSFLLLLNNDMEVLSPDWIEQLLMHAQKADVGAVGALLLYPDDTVQHAGVGVGVTLMAGHYHRSAQAETSGYMNRLCFAHDVSAVTAACMMVRSELFHTLHGLDEAFPVAFNDIDFCLRLRHAGYRVVFTPHARLYHYESLSRGAEDTPAKKARFLRETERFHARWADFIAAGDPFFNINLSPCSEDFTPRR